MERKSKLQILGEVSSVELFKQGWIMGSQLPPPPTTRIFATAVVENHLCKWVDPAFQLQRARGTMRILVAAVNQQSSAEMKIRISIKTTPACQQQAVCTAHRHMCAPGTEQHILRPGDGGLIAVFGSTKQQQPALEFCTKADKTGVMRALIEVKTTCAGECNTALHTIPALLLVVELESARTGKMLAWDLLPWRPTMEPPTPHSSGVSRTLSRNPRVQSDTVNLHQTPEKYLDGLPIAQLEKSMWKKELKKQDRAITRMGKVLDVAAKEGKQAGFSKQQFDRMACHYWDVNSR